MNLKRKINCLLNYTWKMPGIFYCRTSTIFKFEYVSVVFVRKELKLLKRKKSTGLDNLLPRLLKDCADELLDRYVILLISKHINCTNFMGKQAKIMPIHKAGDMNQPANFRPI